MSLKSKSIQSTKWSAIENWASQLLSFSVFLLLARLLQPEDFGLIALASVFIIVLSTLSNQGFIEAIIQRENIEPEHYDTAFWTNVGIAVLLSSGLFFLAPFLADFFSEHELASVLRWLSLGLVVNSLVSVHRAILSRTFKFKALAIRTIFSTIFGGLVGIFMAYEDFGVWALVGQQLSGAVVGVLVLWFSCSWNPGFKFSLRHFSDLFSFGSNVLGMSLLGLVNRRFPDLLIGGFLGLSALGIYLVANKVFTMSTQLLVGTVSKVALPTFSRMQSDLGRMQNAYYSAVQITAVICFPLFTGVLVTAFDLIPFVFGQQWRESADVTQYLMVVGLLYSVGYFDGALIMALGRPNIMLRLGVVNTLLNVFAFIIAVQWGIVAVAIAFMIRGLIMFPVGQFVVRKYASISPLLLLLKLKGAAFATLGMVLTVLIVNSFTVNLEVWLRLVLEISLGGVVYVTSLFIIDRPVCYRILHLLEVVGNKTTN